MGRELSFSFRDEAKTKTVSVNTKMIKQVILLSLLFCVVQSFVCTEYNGATCSGSKVGEFNWPVTCVAQNSDSLLASTVSGGWDLCLYNSTDCSGTPSCQKFKDGCNVQPGGTTSLDCSSAITVVASFFAVILALAF